ncbi:MAG: HD domain-containing protein [Cyanobacteria bacterium P01_A01_bin.84]
MKPNITLHETLEFVNHYHKDDLYGRYPYVYHLFDVANTLRKACLTAKVDEEHTEFLYKAALLHDIIEDHPEICKEYPSMNQVEVCKHIFGEKLGEVVWRLTDEDAPTRKERKSLTLAKTFSCPNASVVKMADRICNITQGIAEGNLNKGRMYFREHIDFLNFYDNSNVTADLFYILRGKYLNLHHILKKNFGE